MREETVIKYIADDGTPFNEDEACQQYEKLCAKYKNWLKDGKVLFWSHAGKFMNIDLCDSAFNYLDWLKEQLSSNCGYVSINEHPCDKAWAVIWEFVVKYLNIDNSTSRKIEPNYRVGDLLAYDMQDCKFHNIDFVARNVAVTKKILMNEVPNQTIKEIDE